MFNRLPLLVFAVTALTLQCVSVTAQTATPASPAAPSPAYPTGSTGTGTGTGTGTTATPPAGGATSGGTTTGGSTTGTTSSGPLIDTPNSLVQCLPTAITWHNAVPPVIIGAYPKGNIAAAPYVTLPTQNDASGSYTWKVNLPAGVVTTLGIRDGNGVTQNTAPRTVQNSTAASTCELVKVPETAYDPGVTDPNINNATTSGGVTSVPSSGSTGGTSSTPGGNTPVVVNGNSTKGTGTTTTGHNAATRAEMLIGPAAMLLAGIVGGMWLV